MIATASGRRYNRLLLPLLVAAIDGRLKHRKQVFVEFLRLGEQAKGTDANGT